MFKKIINFHLLLLVLCLFKGQKLLAQNVGIGTNSPHTSAKLDIQDSNKGLLIPRISIPNLSAAAPVTTPEVSLLVYNNNIATGLGYYYWNGSEWIRLQDQSVGDHDWYGANTTSAPSSISDNIYTLGNVGIGTDNPLFQFEMHGQAPNMNLYRYDNSITPAVFRASKARGTQAAPLSVLANDGLGGLYFGGYNGTGWDFNTAYILSSATEAFSATGSGSNISFYTTANGSITTTEKMRIAHNGNVGIGTIAPSAALNIEHNFEGGFLMSSGGSDGGMIYTKYDNGMAHLVFEEFDDPFILEGFTSLSGQSAILSMYNGNVGIGVTNPNNKLQVGSIGATGYGGNAFAIGNGTDAMAINSNGGKTSFNSNTSFDFIGSGNFLIYGGNVGLGTVSPTEKLEVNGSIKITDGTQGAGKVLVSDATGKGTWELPSTAPALVSPASIGPIPIGSSCVVGGTYTSASITLEPGIYNYTLYSCANQIGQVGAGFNIAAIFLSGSGDASATWHTTTLGSCGHYYTGIVRVTTTSQVAIRYSSYSGSSFNVTGANTEIAQFWKIN
jgi:hypothetical protein